jgi:hypothetical protein
MLALSMLALSMLAFSSLLACASVPESQRAKGSRSPHRGAVDERRFLPTGPLAPAGEAEIVAAHRAGALTNVPPRSAVEYYRAFNAAQDRASVEAQSSGMPYVIVVFDA